MFCTLAVGMPGVLCDLTLLHPLWFSFRLWRFDLWNTVVSGVSLGAVGRIENIPGVKRIIQKNY